MFRIFISYRRGDTRHAVSRVYAALSRNFGRRHVFCDVENIHVGDDYQKYLEQSARACDVMVVLIGGSWIGSNSDGTRRIDDPNDWVHREVALGLARNIPVIPVLVHPSKLPLRSELPDAIAPICDRQWIDLHPDKLFESCLATLVDELRQCSERHLGAVVVAAAKTRRILRRVSHPVSIFVLCLVAGLAAWGTWWVQKRLDRDVRKVDPKVVGAWEDADRRKLEKEIAILRKNPLKALTDDPSDVKEDDLVGSPEYQVFDILSDERIWDLRGWVDEADPSNGGKKSSVSMRRNIRIAKTGDAKVIRFESRTDGRAVFMRCLSHPEKSDVLAQKQAVFVGGREAKSRQIAIDVADVPNGDEFNVRIEATYWGSLQNKNDRWIGAIGYDRSDRIVLIALLPDGRPLVDYELQVSPSSRDVARPFNGPRRVIVADDKMSIMWHIPSPEARLVYSLVLKW